jgi:hypothetical protein
MKRLFGILLWALFCLFGTQLSFGQNNRKNTETKAYNAIIAERHLPQEIKPSAT